MAFADISYFGDRADSGGSPAWSGRVTSTSELDRFDWGGGRKSPFSSVMSGKNGGDMDRLIENALKKRERKAKLTEAMGEVRFSRTSTRRTMPWAARSSGSRAGRT
jgi:hypothetical protein